MQAYQLEPDGAAWRLARGERVRPECGPREVLVRVRAASVDYRDLMIRDGRYPLSAFAGVTPLASGAGEIVATGSAATRFSVGDRVANIYFPEWEAGRLTRAKAMAQPGASRHGTLAEYYLASEEALVAIPAHLTFEEASTLPCAGVTGWSAVNGHRPILPGETVLVVGGGGVALFALQFAAVFGARVIAVTGRAAKAPLLRALGTDEVIVSSEVPDWERRVLELTGGTGAEHVIEAVGPATLGQSVRAAAFDAEIALVGVFSGERGFDASALAGRLLTIRRLAVGSRADFEAMNRAIAVHALRPVVDRVFAFEAAPAAYQHFASGDRTGKVVIAGTSD